MTKFVIDTSSFIQSLPEIPFENAIVNTLVLRELEKHKSNSERPDLQKAARDALRAIEENEHLIEFDFRQYPKLTHLDSQYDSTYTDNRLLESLFHHKNEGKDVGMLSEDLSLVLQAKSFGFKARKGLQANEEPYHGTICIPLTDSRVSDFYQLIYSETDTHTNLFNMKNGEYLLLVDEAGCDEGVEEKSIGAFKWTGNKFQRITMNQRIHSSYFSEVKPKNFRQAIAMDSLKNNPLTTITGKAGSGKTYLAIAYIMQQLQNYETPVYIVTNNVPMRGANTFGLKKGDITDKVLQSNLGNILKNKIGIDQTRFLVERELITIVPLEDIRGASFNGIVYATEVQNYSVDMLKTILERVEDEEQDGFGKVILEGDQRQIDTHLAKGKNSGIHRMFEVYQNTGILGHVELRGNIRGGISALADKM